MWVFRYKLVALLLQIFRGLTLVEPLLQLVDFRFTFTELLSSLGILRIPVQHDGQIAECICPFLPANVRLYAPLERHLVLRVHLQRLRVIFDRLLVVLQLEMCGTPVRKRGCLLIEVERLGKFGQRIFWLFSDHAHVPLHKQRVRQFFFVLSHFGWF